MKKKLNYDYCQAAPVLEWMSQKWALVVMLRIEEYEKESIRFSELFRTFPQVSEKVLASTLDYLLQEGLVTYSLTKLCAVSNYSAITPL